MTFTSKLDADTLVIDDRNAGHFVDVISDPSTPFTGGYKRRDYNRHPFGSVAPAYTGGILPRSRWDDEIKRQEDKESSPDNWRVAADVPILDQNGLGYCWMYGIVGAIMTVYAQQQIPVPHLSATGPAAQGKRYRNEGGWAGEAIGYIQKYGIPTLDVWPEHSLDTSLAGRHEVQLSAARHGIVDFLELPRNNFDALASALLSRTNPRPVTLGLNWWGHLVYATKLVKIDARNYGVLIVNSWKKSWGNRGTAVLTESKATAYEQVIVKRALPKAA